MFVQNLNFKQQCALLFLAHKVAEADGHLHEMQLDVMSALAKQGQPGVIAQAVSDDDLAPLFDSKKAKYSLLLELIGVAMVDREFHRSEQILLAHYAQLLGVESAVLAELEQWVTAQFELMDKVNALLA